ncbi:hypothetical protein E2562_014036 [Oryza meyeriana var. granulata]|uniref:DUF2828 domain-containing protein n=1 Tax=Oryza meyeriana var. granulata TaxID=110450 RepID=A0A6G1DIG4_9ORYZ|nr:hypothetical protein E2562_014036 [Oryza meyeriana var. granulata]
MRQYKGVFEKHDNSGVAGFLDEVRTGNARVPVDEALPHALVAAAVRGEHDEAAELQWRRMVLNYILLNRETNGFEFRSPSWDVSVSPA